MTDAPETRPLHVVFSAATMVSGAMGGSEVYARQIFSRLASNPGLTMSAVVPRHDALRHSQSSVAVRTTGSSTSAGRLASLLMMNASRTARAAMQEADVIHYPFQVQAPPPPRRAHTVITIHDVQHLEIPSFFTRAERLYRHLLYDLPASKCPTIITISPFSKRQISRRLGIDPNRIHVAPLGHDVEDSPNLGARDDFVLYPARAWPHKNHDRLIKAMSIVRLGRKNLRLVLTGASTSDFPELPSWVTVLGQVPRDQLLGLYRSAACMVFPSLYEGFGLPLLEAMASGCPVAASNLAAIPDLCGDAVSYFNPYEPSEIAKSIEFTLQDATRLSVAGVDRSQQFSWDACAQRHAAIYRLSASLSDANARTHEQ